MSYDTLIAALVEEGEAKAEAILRKAGIDADRVLAETKASLESFVRTQEIEYRKEHERRQNAARDEASVQRTHIVLRAKHAVLEQVWQAVWARASTITGALRIHILRALLDEVLTAAQEGTPHVVVHARDQSFLEHVLKERRLSFTVEERDDLLLGVELEARGERFRNSFASRLEKAKPELLVELNAMLFSDGTPVERSRPEIGRDSSS